MALLQSDLMRLLYRLACRAVSSIVSCSTPVTHGWTWSRSAVPMSAPGA